MIKELVNKIRENNYGRRKLGVTILSTREHYWVRSNRWYFNAVGINESDNIKADESLNEIKGDRSKGHRIKASFSKNNNIVLYVDSNNK